MKERENENEEGGLLGGRPVEELAVGGEAVGEFGVVQALDGDGVVNREGGGGGGGLRGHHEYRLHPGRAKGDVGGGQGEGDKEILAFANARDDGAVGDG